MTRAYIQFTELFSDLSPYELNHLCEVMLCKIEQTFGSVCLCENTKIVLAEKNILFALTHTMRDISVQLCQKEINEQKIRMFANTN
jgi:hypothetical protein